MMLGRVLLFLLILPSAAAQVTLTVGDHSDAPLVGDVEIRDIPLSVELDCGPVINSWIGTTSPLSTSTVTLELLESRPDVTWTGPTAVTVPTQDCLPGQTRSVDTTWNVAVTRDAPAFTDLPSTIKATWGAQGLADGGSHTGEVVVRAAFLPLLQAVVTQSIVDVEDGKAHVSVILSNLGNAQTRVDMERVGEAPAEVGRLILPPPVILGAPGEPFSEVAVDLYFEEVPALGFRNEQAAYQIRFTPSAALDPSQEGAPVMANALFRMTHGSPSEDSPAPVLLVPLAVGLVVVWRQRSV